MRSLLVLSLAAGAALVAAPRPAAACSLFDNNQLVVVASDDTVAPTAPVEVRRRIDRSEEQGTCEAHGWIELELTATDDRTPPAQLAFEITLRAGTLPGGLVLPVGPVMPRLVDYFVFYFDPGELDLAFELEVRAVDPAGNRSAPTVVAIENHVLADDEGGCSTGAARPHALGPVVVALALLVARRRRRTRA